jgi:acetyl-CoA synthetase
MADNLSQLLATPLQPLPEQWRSAAQDKLLVQARARHEQSPDSYWTWAAEQQRWMRPWDTVRTGELGDFSYFAGGLMNVADNCVDRWAQDPATADRTAVSWEGEPGDVRTISYGELADEVSRLAGALASLGLAKGDVVAIYLPNAIEAFTAVHACNRIGAIYTILFSGFGPDAVRSRLEAARAKAVIVLDASWRRGKLTPLLDTLRAARSQAGTVEHTIVVDRTGRGVPLESGEISYTDALALVPEGIPATPLEANDPAFLIFTSGTEARPKGVVHSVAGFLLGTWANVRGQVGPEDGDVYWVAADVGWLTFPIQGEPLDGETFAWATRHLGGVPVINAYGQTETGSTWAYSVAGVDPLKPGSTGTAVPGHVYDILDDNGKPVPPGTKGNLVLTQPFPTLARTVWDDPDRYRDAYFSRFPGCYCTNDEAVLDEDGADPGQVKQEVAAEVGSSLGGYARLGAVEHGEPQGDISAMEDVSGLQAVQRAVTTAAGM